MNKKGFLDTEILASPGFVILAALVVGGTLLGWIWARKQGWEAFPVWQLILVLIGELGIAYGFALRG